MENRNKCGRFKKQANSHSKCLISSKHIITDHNYVGNHVCPGRSTCTTKGCPYNCHFNGVDRDGWRHGRRIVEWEALLSNLETCKECHLGPIPLTINSIIGERQRGLGGYLYVMCQNPDCMAINRAATGKTHRQKAGAGMPCFDVNTKLGIGK